jgi:hypothetical protein
MILFFSGMISGIVLMMVISAVIVLWYEYE